MDRTEMQRAAAVVRARMEELDLTPNDIARAAHLDPTTVRALIRGERWPRESTRARINKVLGWPHGEVTRRAFVPALDQISTPELARELYERVRNNP